MIAALATQATQIATMTSREIAELTGKEHAHVMRDIRAMLSELELAEGGYLQNWIHPQNGQAYQEFALNRELTETLLTGYSASARLKVIRRWHELEAKAPGFDPTSLTRIDILKLAMESEEGRIKAESERDLAIATKHMIGSRREATAMATASAACRETASLKIQLGKTASHSTVRAIEKALGRKFGWLPLKTWCAAHGATPETVPDDLYGSVKSWPAAAWLDCFGIDTAAVMGVSNG